MKIAFFWTWIFSKNFLTHILTYKNVDVQLIVSQPDKYVWRKKILEKTPIKILAQKHNINILQPEKLLKNSHFLDTLDSYNFDFILVVAYGKIVTKRVLNSAKYWCINVHGSILPQYRWASPIQEALKNWDTQTWLTIMHMSRWMDEWDLLKIEKVNIDTNDTTPDIFQKFELIWPQITLNVLEKIISWKSKSTKQNHEKATYCNKISKEDWEVKFSEETITNIYNKYRAYYSWPWIYCFYKNIKLNIEECSPFLSIDYDWEEKELIPWKIIKINKKTIWIVCWDKKILLVKQVKLAGKKSMDIISFINGNKDFLDYNF